MRCARKTLFLVRTHIFDQMTFLLAERLGRVENAKVVIVADESRGLVDTSPIEKVSMTAERLKELGFDRLPADWGWFCGDMCYYAGAAAYPDFEQYFLVESDVFIPNQALGILLDAINASDAEAVASYLGPTDETKRFSKGLARFNLDPNWGCLFPMTYVTADVLNTMWGLRSDALKKFPKIRLNDEAILAGAVQEGRYSYATWETLSPKQFNWKIFNTNPPHMLETLYNDPTERRVFHPVVPFAKIKERILTGEKNYTRHRMRAVLRYAAPDLKSELEQAMAEKAARKNAS